MPKLRLDEAPAAAMPLRFLLAMPCWGVAGGVLLLIDGDAPLHARWHPATLALVHAWTLGVLGNAMFGSLLQFLPAAAGAKLRWSRSAPWLHAVFNLGALLLVIGLHGYARWLLLVAGTLLPLAFLWLAAMTLPGLCVAAGERLLRAGIAAALTCGVATALVGGALALLLASGATWPLSAVDAHAAFGVLGWMVLLLAAVGRVTMPMFQATGSVPARAQAIWLGAVVLALPFAGVRHLMHPDDMFLPVLVAFGGAGFALAVLALQWPVPKTRRNALFLQWRAGAFALALAAPALLAGQGMLAGMLALAVGLPLLVGAMAMEIVPFIAWIDLRHRIPRGVRIPGVQRLLSDARKRRVLLAQALAAPLLVLALLWPQAWLARLAGAAQCVAWIVHGHALLGAMHGARAFARSVEKLPEDVPMSNDLPLVYSCSGCSSAAQMANHLALQLDRAGVAEMSCIAGVGGGVTGLVRTAQGGRRILALDGCVLKCVAACLANAGVMADAHLVLSEYGVKKRKHADFDPVEAQRIYHAKALPAAHALRTEGVDDAC